MDIKLIVFDLDGTLVKYENSLWYGSWDAIGYAAGLKGEFDRLTSYYLPRLELYEDWAEANAMVLKDVSVKMIEEKIFPPPYSKGVKKTLPLLTGRYKTMILSSGVDLVAERVREELGIDFAISNRLLRENGVFTGEAACDVPLEKKVDVLKVKIEGMGISLKDICAVGDNENDIPLLRSCGIGIAFEPRTENVKNASKYIINDFKQILDILNSGSF